MDSLRSVATLARRKDRCETGNSNTRSNMGFSDTTSLESIFSQLGVSPSIPSKTETINRSKTSRSSEPRVLKVARKSFDTMDIDTPRQHERHLKISPELLAQQITLIELKLFQAIQPEEFLSLKWNSKEKMTYAPNIVASTRWFNQIIFWVQKDLLREEILSRRSEVLSHFVRIAKKLVEMNNYSSAMAVVSGLLVQSVYRLSATWTALSSRDRSSFRKLADLFSQEQNFINLRTAVDTARLPCIPYLGIYLSDLTFIDVAAATVSLHENGGSWGRQSKENRLNNLLRIIANFQQSSYPFVRDEKIASYLESQGYIEELQRFIEDNNYKLSLRLEPPSGETFIPTSNDSVYPFPVKTNWFTSTVLKPIPVSNAPPDSGSLERRTTLLPSQEYTSLSDSVGSPSVTDIHSSHSSPAHSISHGHRASNDGFFPPPLIFPPRSYVSHTKSVRDRPSPHKTDRYPHDSSAVHPRVKPSARHRRLGSWTAMGYSLDIPSEHACASRITVFLNDRPSPLDNINPSSCSASSGSTNRSPLAVDHSVPVQQPLGQLLDQTDLVTAAAVPSSLSSTSSITGPNQDAAGSSSSGAASGSSSIRSNRPKALTAILPNQPKVPLSHQTHGSPSGDSNRSLDQLPNSTHENVRTRQLLRVSTSYTSPRSLHPADTTVKLPTSSETRMRPSLSQPRTLLQKSVSDRRVRTSPNKHNSGERKSRPYSTESAVNPFLPVHSGRATPTRHSDSICQEAKGSHLRPSISAKPTSPRTSSNDRPPPRSAHSADCFQDTPSANIPDTLVAATLQSKCPSEVPVPQIYRACIKRSPFTRPFSSSCALFSTSQSHSKYPVSPDQSPDSIFLPTTVSTTQSHLAQAALAAVQGAVADELARLSDTDNRHFSLPHLLPSPSNLISPTKAVCLDVQFANGLRVLREGVIRYRRCSKDAFRRAQAAQSSFGLNNTVCTWFGSCNALDTFRERPNNRTKLSVSFSGSSHIDHQTCCEYSGQLGPHVLTPSPSHSASRVSFTSFVLDLPSFCSSSTASSSSLSVSDAPSSSSTAQSSLPVRCTASSHTTKQTYSVPESGKLATVAGKRSLVSWFHRLITARHDPRAKLCWGVLVQSDASRSPAFLVLFKLHPSSIGSSYCLHDVSTRATVDIPTQPVVTTDKQSSGASTAPKSDDERLRVKAYTPEMFSTSRCRVLAIDTAIMDHRSARIPSVIIVDVMGLKHKPYRLLSATANSYTMPCAEQQYNTLAAVRSHVRGELLGVLPKSESVNSSRPDATLRVPRAKWYRSPNALKSFRRLWPTTWMAMRRPRSEKSNKSQTRSPQTTPTSQVRNLNSANLDQTSTETHPVWLPLLTLFPDELA